MQKMAKLDRTNYVMKILIFNIQLIFTSHQTCQLIEGCASLQYMQGDNLAVQLSFGENILTSTIVSGKNPKAVCVSLPGGFSKFCGRIYSIKKETDRHFKACLGLELQSATDLEASLRVSCFRFGPDGLKLRPAEPLPVVEAVAAEEDDDDDIFGLGSDDDDDDDDEGDDEVAPNPQGNASPIASTADDEDDEDDDDDDVLGFSALLDIFTGDEESSTKKTKTSIPTSTVPAFTIPLLTTSVSSTINTQSSATTRQPIVEISTENEALTFTDDNNLENTNVHTAYVSESSTENYYSDDQVEDSTTYRNEQVIEDTVNYENLKNVSHKPKPNRTSVNKKDFQNNKIKTSITSGSINAIKNDSKKPAKKPNKPKPTSTDLNIDDDDDDVDDILGLDNVDEDDKESEYLLETHDEDDKKDEEEEDDIADDDDDDDDDVIDDDDDEDDEEDDEEKLEGDKEHLHEDHVTKYDEKIYDLDLDDDNEEDAALSALIDNHKEDAKNSKLSHKKQTSNQDEADYGIVMT